MKCSGKLLLEILKPSKRFRQKETAAMQLPTNLWTIYQATVTIFTESEVRIYLVNNSFQQLSKSL